jgi:hypothetical protein
MKRRLTLLALLLGLLFATSVVVLVGGRDSAAAGPIYTVPEVREGLARHPAAWLGRTIRVRGTPLPGAISAAASSDNTGEGHGGAPRGAQPISYVVCEKAGGVCAGALYPLVDHLYLIWVLTTSPTGSPSPGDVFSGTNPGVILVTPIYESDMMRGLRRIPLLGQYMPSAQRLNFSQNQAAVYRLRLQRAPVGAPWCAAKSCYYAQLLDTAS